MSSCGATLAGKLAAGLGLSLLLACGDLPPRQQPAPAEIFRLVEVAESAGVLFRHVSGSPDKRQIYEANSGGVAWLASIGVSTRR